MSEENLAELKERVEKAKGELDETIKDFVDDVFGELSDEEKGIASNALREMILKEKSPGDALKISEALLQFCYNEAYNQYNLGQYEQALETFKFLTYFDPNSPRYVLGVASCEYKLKNYPTAIRNFFKLSHLEPESPYPYYYLIDCCEEINDRENLLTILSLCIQRCGDVPEYSQLKERCLLMLRNVAGELGVPEEDVAVLNKTEKTSAPIEEVDIFSQLEGEARKKS